MFVLLFISPKTQALDSNPAETGASSETKPTVVRQKRSVMDVYLNMAVKNLEPSLSRKHQILVKAALSDSLILFWDQLKRPDLASYFAEEKAEKSDSASYWYKAGNRYYYAIAFVHDQSEVPVLYDRAMTCFEKSIAADKQLTDARIMLAACYVEGGSDPMQGISLLKALEKTDSNNVKLQMTFAFFSVKSGQLDKAITRFKKVLQIDSTKIEVYLHLADAYEKMEDKNNTIKMLEAYQLKTEDPTARIEIGKYIDQLKSNN